jgi:hypothetical protein
METKIDKKLFEVVGYDKEVSDAIEDRVLHIGRMHGED